MLPADAGCVVDNVATISAIYRAVAKGEPSMDRIVTVSGDAVHEPGNFKVPFGMNQAELIEAMEAIRLIRRRLFPEVR